MNKVLITGRISNIRPINNGNAFNVAVYDGIANDNTIKTVFIECVCFGNTSKFLQKHFSVGRAIELIGKISNSKYEKEGVTKYSTNVIVEEIGFVKSDRREPELEKVAI